jgi:hypothetical protein
MILPLSEVFMLSEEAFDLVDGFELRFGAERDGAFLVGYNRFNQAVPMYGTLSITGNATSL